jgi:protein-L-isoaspartate O-methyltransferase
MLRRRLVHPSIAKVARHVSAIDIDLNFLEVARHRLSENGVTNCNFIAGDAYDIAKLAAPAELVFMANASSLSVLAWHKPRQAH